MKELDLKLERYLDQCWAEAAAPERAAFVALLEAPDPEIWGLLLGRETPPEGEAARLIQRLQEL
jgi:succinate dehydrogenase flavin-adding protein (antitoxin of CptAB toxin-antitoxin module)